jgi:hypothetical protein
VLTQWFVTQLVSLSLAPGFSPVNQGEIILKPFQRFPRSRLFVIRLKPGVNEKEDAGPNRKEREWSIVQFRWRSGFVFTLIVQFAP